MFLYGPPGTGKSSIAERLIRVHDDHVLVPHAVEVDSQIIIVFDPVVHRPVDEQPDDLDPRWVLCRRPCVIVGGELDRRHARPRATSRAAASTSPRCRCRPTTACSSSTTSAARRCTPEELLNRWIVPLDRRHRLPSLEYGVKFEVPFDAKIVFSTNLARERSATRRSSGASRARC